jgi:hypothetical protein
LAAPNLCERGAAAMLDSLKVVDAKRTVSGLEIRTAENDILDVSLQTFVASFGLSDWLWAVETKRIVS